MWVKRFFLVPTAHINKLLPKSFGDTLDLKIDDISNQYQNKPKTVYSTSIITIHCKVKLSI